MLGYSCIGNVTSRDTYVLINFRSAKEICVDSDLWSHRAQLSSAEPSRCCPVPATRVLFSSSLQNATSQPRERKKILNKNADYWRRTKSVDVVVVAVVVVVIVAVVVASHVVPLTTTNLQLEFWFWELERAKLFELFEDSRNWSWAIHYILKILKFELLVFV